MADYRFNMTGTEMERRLDLANTALQPGWMPTAAEVGALVKSDLLNMVYPVGSIYMSVNNVSPASFLGGTWEQIQGRFLLAADGAHPAGSTGGEETVSLTAEQNGPHQHMGLTVDGTSIAWTWPTVSIPGSGNNGTLTTDGTTVPVSGSSGGGAPHNNMPPYLAVYVWKRTA